MENQFWFNKWKKKEIGFHQDKVNESLVKHFSKLSLDKGSRVFVPLCGKTLDIKWLLEQGYHVVAVELVESAVDELFLELGEVYQPVIQSKEKFKHYSAGQIDVYVGDLFNLTKELLGKVDAIYDRASLIALPVKTRQKYAQFIVKLSEKAPILLIVIEYDQQERSGPPFSVDEKELCTLYPSFDLKQLEKIKYQSHFKKVSQTYRSIYLLKP